MFATEYDFENHEDNRLTAEFRPRAERGGGRGGGRGRQRGGHPANCRSPRCHFPEEEEEDFISAQQPRDEVETGKKSYAAAAATPLADNSSKGTGASDKTDAAPSRLQRTRKDKKPGRQKPSTEAKEQPAKPADPANGPITGETEEEDFRYFDATQPGPRPNCPAYARWIKLPDRPGRFHEETGEWTYDDEQPAASKSAKQPAAAAKTSWADEVDDEKAAEAERQKATGRRGKPAQHPTNMNLESTDVSALMSDPTVTKIGLEGGWALVRSKPHQRQRQQHQRPKLSRIDNGDRAVAAKSERAAAYARSDERQASGRSRRTDR
jgi:hypothetical protein